MAGNFRGIVLAVLLGAGMLTAPGAVRAAARSAPPTLAVVGFGLVDTPPATATPPVLELNLTVHGITASAAVQGLAADLAAIAHRLALMGLRAAAVQPQAPPQLNYLTATGVTNCQKVRKIKPGVTCQKAGFAASEGVAVTFPSLTSLARALSQSDIATAHGVQNFWINQGGSQPGAPTTAALTAGYRAALAAARRTAEALAAADGRRLGPAVSVTEGAPSSVAGCGMGGCGAPTGIPMPTPGPNQMLVAVTVTYTTQP